MIDITDVKINLVKDSKILAYVAITIEDSIVISGIRLYEGSKGKFLVFPSRKSKRGRNFDIAFPCKDEIREQILKQVEMCYSDEIL